MPLSIALELSDEDLKYFSRVVDSIWKNSAKRPEHELLADARARIKQANKSRAPAYVTQRLAEISLLIEMLDDKEWSVEFVPEDRRRILAAISYFATPKDLISDRIPGIGYLDDALVAELVIRELRHDIAGYREFQAFRSEAVPARAKKDERDLVLAKKRRRLLDRIDQRRERMWSRMTESDLTDPILKYKY